MKEETKDIDRENGEMTEEELEKIIAGVPYIRDDEWVDEKPEQPEKTELGEMFEDELETVTAGIPLENTTYHK